MGKAKSRRQKYHASAARLKKSTASEKQSDQTPPDDVEMSGKNKTEEETSSLLEGGIFKNINIDLSKASKELPDFDARSAITSKTFKGLNMSKKEKRKLKHDTWMKKLPKKIFTPRVKRLKVLKMETGVDTIQAARKEAKERKRRQKTAVVGDMKPLEDTLPTLELLLRDTSSQRHSQREEAKPKAIKKTKQRQKEMLKDIEVFKQVLQHPVFQKDPGATITEHLKNKLKHENMDT